MFRPRPRKEEPGHLELRKAGQAGIILTCRLPKKSICQLKEGIWQILALSSSSLLPAHDETIKTSDDPDYRRRFSSHPTAPGKYHVNMWKMPYFPRISPGRLGTHHATHGRHDRLGILQRHLPLGLADRRRQEKGSLCIQFVTWKEGRASDNICVGQ